MDVSDVLRDRMREPAGLQRMVTLSVGLHVAAGAIVLVLGTGRWLSQLSEPPRTVMTITLSGGGGGPNAGGATPIGGRPVQAVETAPAKEAARPPAPTTPDMTVPRPAASPVKPRPKVAQAPEQARGRTPTSGAEVRTGSAIAETGARGQGFGLSTGSGSGLGSRLDVADFCCPDYVVLMTNRIRSNWNQQAEVSGEVVIRFVIQRDGTIKDVSVERSSGYSALDLGAQRAVVITRQLPPLPADFSNPTLTMHLTFQYQR
jgi:protein TonB